MIRRIHLPSAAIALVGAAFLAGCSSSSANAPTTGSQLSSGVKAARMDLWREARFRFERAVELDPNDAMARNNLAVALEGSGDFERARVEYLKALQIDKSNQYIQKNYSRFTEFYTRNKRRDTGADARDKAASTPPASPKSGAAPPSAGAPGTQPPAGTPDPAAPPPPPPGQAPGGAL